MAAQVQVTANVTQFNQQMNQMTGQFQQMGRVSNAVNQSTSRFWRQQAMLMQRGTASLNGLITSLRGVTFLLGPMGIATGLALTAIGVGIRTAMKGINALHAKIKEIKKDSAKHGLGTDEYQKLGYIAKQTGSDMTVLLNVLDKITSALEKAEAGEAKYLRFLSALKIGFNDLKGLKADQIFQRIADSIKYNKIDLRSIKDIKKILGEEGIRAIENLGKYDIGALSRQFDRAGTPISQDTIQVVDNFKRAMDDGTTSFMKTVIEMDLFKKALGSLTNKIDELVNTDTPPGTTSFNKEWHSFLLHDPTYLNNMRMIASGKSPDGTPIVRRSWYVKWFDSQGTSFN